MASLFSEFPNVKLVQGILPESLENQEIDVISYLSIETNNAQTKVGTVEIPWDKMIERGVILLDD